MQRVAEEFRQVGHRHDAAGVGLHDAALPSSGMITILEEAEIAPVVPSRRDEFPPKRVDHTLAALPTAC
jgi:hypothetical protein